MRKPLESSSTEVGSDSTEPGCINKVSSSRPTAWPRAPTVRKGQYSFHHARCREVLKAQERLSWKFERFATRNAMVEYTWYQRTLKSLNGSPATPCVLRGAELVGHDQGDHVHDHAGDADGTEAREQDEVATVPYQHGLSQAAHPPRLAGRSAPRRRSSGRDTFGNMATTTPRFRGPVLPDGEVRDLYVVDGRVTWEPQAGAETVAEGWIVPGLVDAHCHIGLDDHGPVSDEESEAQAIEDRDAGALLIRDAGSPADTRWVQDRDDLPRLIRCGRHLARTKRYIRNYADEIEPGELAAAAAREARAGDGWIKLVGDWISREEGDLAPSFPAEAFAAAIAAAHEHGARVTAHCFGAAVLPGLIEAGIDCIEHGTGLDQGLIDAMVARGTALVPTVMQLDKFPEYAEAGAERFPAYAVTMTDLYDRRRATIMAAYDAGVPLYAGSDGGGVSPPRQPAGRGARDGRARDAGGVRARRRLVAGPRVARLERHPRRGRPRRPGGLRPRPPRRPDRAAFADAGGAARCRRCLGS